MMQYTTGGVDRLQINWWLVVDWNIITWDDAIYHVAKGLHGTVASCTVWVVRMWAQLVAIHIRGIQDLSEKAQGFFFTKIAQHNTQALGYNHVKLWGGACCWCLPSVILKTHLKLCSPYCHIGSQTYYMQPVMHLSTAGLLMLNLLRSRYSIDTPAQSYPSHRFVFSVSSLGYLFPA